MSAFIWLKSLHPKSTAHNSIVRVLLVRNRQNSHRWEDSKACSQFVMFLCGRSRIKLCIKKTTYALRSYVSAKCQAAQSVKRASLQPEQCLLLTLIVNALKTHKVVASRHAFACLVMDMDVWCRMTVRLFLDLTPYLLKSQPNPSKQGIFKNDVCGSAQAEREGS